jgi:hypothetical protein
MTEQTDLAALIAQLEVERNELDVTIAHLRRRAGMPSTNGEPPATLPGVSGNLGRDVLITGRVRPDEFYMLSQRDAIIKFLSIMKQPQNPLNIANGLKSGGVLSEAKNFTANIHTELKRMKQRGILVNTASGWGLAEWYPRAKLNEASKGAKQAAREHGKRSGKPAKRGGKAGASGKQVPMPAAGDVGQPDWHQFLTVAIKGGKSMKEAAAEWKERKAAVA